MVTLTMEAVMSESNVVWEESPVIDNMETSQELERQYVCFVKRCPGGRFVPYTESGDNSKVVARSLRQFLDHEIDLWFKAGEKEKLECRPILKVTLEDFAADVHANGMNAKLVSMLGWNYPTAARMAESEGTIFLLTVHPRFQSIPFSFRRVCEDNFYALHFVEQLLSLRGGEIAFEEYRSGWHAENKEYCGVSDVRSVR